MPQFVSLLTLDEPFIPQVVDPASRGWRILRRNTAYLAVCLLSTICYGQTPTLVDAIGEAKQTIAPVVCMVSNPNTANKPIRFRILGTAIMVDTHGVFITAWHVMDDLLNNSPWKNACVPAITFPVGGWKRADTEVNWFAILTNCQVTKLLDVVVCQTIFDLSKQGVSFKTGTISTEQPLDGTAIFFTGFPLQATDPVTSVGTIAGFVADGGYTTLMIDKNAWPGASGSPIYLADGKTIVGMILKTGTGDAAGLSFGISGAKLTEILASARSNWKKEREQNQPPEPAKK
jgi:hypothetical protein